MADLGLYRVFYAVAKTGSLTRAAKELYISQPAVSQAIKQLETQLGGRLFVRTPKGMRLTEGVGETMFGYIEKAMELIRAAENKFYQIKNLAVGTLHIGASDTILKHLILPAIDGFHAAYPQIKLQITNCTSRESLDYLKAGSVDVAFVNLPLNDDTVNIRECAEVHDIFVAGSAYLRLAGSILSLRELCEEPLIMLENKSNTRKIVTDFFKSHGIDLSPDIELGSLELLSDFALKGLGVACVPREYVLPELDSGTLFEVQTNPPVPSRRIGLLTLRAVPLSFAVKEFISLFPAIK